MFGIPADNVGTLIPAFLISVSQLSNSKKRIYPQTIRVGKDYTPLIMKSSWVEGKMTIRIEEANAKS